MKSYNEYLSMVNDAIHAIDYPKQPAQLYEPIIYTMNLGGKRVRPVLTLMACEALGGDPTKALEAAVGIELFHNFTLLHDDVMDHADVRRGKPTVHRRWNDNVAILCGDAMFTLATQHVQRVDDRHLPQAMRLFNRTAIEIMEGQQWDMDFELRHDVTEAEYIEMIRLKTSVLLGCACEMGAIIADASDTDRQAIYDMAMYMGLAFQLQDDMLDVWGDPATFGKEVGGDIMNNKKTFLLIHAQERAQGDDALELCRWLNDPYALRDEKYPAVRAIYERLGLRELSEQAVAHYNAMAIDALNRINFSDEAHQTFANLIAQLTNREK